MARRGLRSGDPGHFTGLVESGAAHATRTLGIRCVRISVKEMNLPVRAGAPMTRVSTVPVCMTRPFNSGSRLADESLRSDKRVDGQGRVVKTHDAAGKDNWFGIALIPTAS